MRHYSRTVQK